ncbi:MAG: hypothetical protein FJY97_10350 [candidate division Zixibacteria bacterium]|nr:hypothetical protein [candidate division Zixibacteria bacterium]
MTRDQYLYCGAYALVTLHERHIRSFLHTWKQAADTRLVLPPSGDPNYASLEDLLKHVLRASRGYMVWICEKLSLPDPAIDPPPETAEIAAKADAYLEHLLERWRAPLTGLTEERAYKPAFTLRWGTDYCIDAMLEHAVMHPVRHEFQLIELVTQKKA